jgi:hypothetical protein
MRWRIETQPGSGKRISNRSAERLRYFGRAFLAAALDIRSEIARPFVQAASIITSPPAANCGSAAVK